MQVMYERCAGLDVHKETVVACVVKGPDGTSTTKEVRTFGTATQELLRLRDWLDQEGVTHVAMESTGVYWKPVFNLLEGGPELWVINAHHVKNLPGRKTDVKDCEWLADLLRHGLVKPSFVPDTPTRDLRELTRYRTQVVRERASEVNRLQKILEGANIKLSSVASDVAGVSGKAILKAMAAGETDPQKLAELAVGRLAQKREDLILALEGRVRDHHRFMLKAVLRHLDDLDRLIEELDAEVEKRLRPFEEKLRRLDAIPGIGQRTAEILLAELGTEMSRFQTSGHLASWAGICPGNNQSGGKRLSGKTRKGSPWLRGALVEAAWSAIRVKASYFKAQYARLKGRRGPKKAIIAVAHSILVTVYHLLSRPAPYTDLGKDHFERLDRERIVRRLTRRIEELGFDVSLKKKEPAA